MNICENCVCEPIFENVSLMSGLIDNANTMNMKLVDDALEKQRESKNLAANPVRDQEIAFGQDQIAIFGAVIFDVFDTKQVMDAIIDGPACTDEAKASSNTGCPKIDAIKPMINSLIDSMNIITKDML